MNAKMLLLGIAILPLFGGCTNANSEPENSGGVAPAEVAAPTNTPPPANSPAAAVPMPTGQVVNPEMVLPESVKLSPAATEIAKLARAGVDAGVMLAYVTNSVNTYNLSSDEIVYLNDLGLHPAVAAAMIQHDQQIREASLNGAMAASPATPSPGQFAGGNGPALPASSTWQQPVAAPAPVSDMQTTVPPPPEEERPSEVTVNYFYDSLAPYGTWIDVDGYGRCWRPTAVATTPGWRPYEHGGRWVWSDNGWYWYSDYSWGWAPYHYGRWFSDPYWGWCWMPGTVWGPSWVSWRYTDSYCGWAPLPPAAYYRPTIGFTYYGNSCNSSFSFGLTWDCFTFVSYNNFSGRNYNKNCVPRNQSAQVYNNSTVVNNIINGDNNTIINQGIGTDRITRATRSEIPRVRVRDQAANGTPRTGRQETLAANGQTLNVTRHTVPGGNPGTRTGSVISRTADATPSTRSAFTPTQSPSTRGESVRAGGAVGSTGQSAGGSLTPRNGFSQAPSAALASPAVAAEPATPAPTAASAPSAPSAPSARSQVNRTRGALFIRGSQATETASTAPTRNTPSPTRDTTAAPWLNNTTATPVTPVTPDPTPTVQAEQQSPVRYSTGWGGAPTRQTRTDNSVAIRSQQSVLAAPAPQAAPAPVQQTPRTYQSPGFSRSQQSVRQASPGPQTSRNNNNVVTIPNWQTSPTRSAPQSAPAPRSFAPPSRTSPGSSYSPATRSAPSRVESSARPTPPSRQPSAPAQPSAPVLSGNNSPDASSRPSGSRR